MYDKKVDIVIKVFAKIQIDSKYYFGWKKNNM